MRPALRTALDEIGHDTGMSNNSGDADGTIDSRVTLDEFEVDRLAGRETLTSVAKRISTCSMSG